jgi:hypothetical protein
VGRVDERAVGQGEQLVVHGPVEAAGEVVRGPADRGQQVGPTHVANEQRVAGEDGPGLGVGVLVDDDRDRLGGVTGRVPDLEGDLAEGESLAVRQGVDRELGHTLVTEGDDRAGGLGELQVARQEVGVEVGLDHPLDGQPVGLGVGQIAGDVALGIHDDGPTGRLVADHVAEQRQAGELVLLEVHRSSLSGQVEEHLLDIVELIALLGRCIGVVQAPGEACRDQMEPGLLEGARRGRELGDDLTAVAAVGQHRLDAAHLTLDPTEAPGQVVDGLVGQIHGRLLALRIPLGVP